MKIIDEWRQEDYENGKKEEKINLIKAYKEAERIIAQEFV